MKLGSKHTAEAKQKIGNASRGKKHTLESRRKVSEARKGKRHSEESKRKIGEANRGRKHTPEARAKISAAMMGEKNPNWGKRLSLETKQKLSEAHQGKIMTLESRQKMSEARRGEKNPNWKGGWIYHNGYIRILLPDHPNASLSGYVYEHRLIMEEHLGRLLDSAEIVHHINGNPADNQGENLMLFPSQAEHMVYHRKIGRYYNA